MKKPIAIMFFILMTGLLLNTTAIASDLSAPIGLTWGMTEVDAIKEGVVPTKTERKGPLSLVCTNEVPIPVSFAEEYLLVFHNTWGLQKMLIVGETIDNDIYGMKGKRLYSDIKKLLIKKYGNTEKSYEYVGRELFDEQDEFYQCLKYPGCGNWISLFKTPDIKFMLQLNGIKRGRGYVDILFEGPKWDEYLENKKNQNQITNEQAL